MIFNRFSYNISNFCWIFRSEIQFFRICQFNISSITLDWNIYRNFKWDNIKFIFIMIIFVNSFYCPHIRYLFINVIVKIAIISKRFSWYFFKIAIVVILSRNKIRKISNISFITIWCTFFSESSDYLCYSYINIFSFNIFINYNYI